MNHIAGLNSIFVFFLGRRFAGAAFAAAAGLTGA
jgi:hypothetical protein